jgi:hypothetical protein
MNKKVRLSRYERGIAEELINQFGYSPEDARELVVRYIGVVRKLGGYDSCLDYAERLDHAKKEGYSPEEWLERIRTLEVALDDVIPQLENFDYIQAR